MKTSSGKAVSKIGIGSYGIGGRGHRDMELTEKEDDQVYIEAVAHALNKGSNFTEIAIGYGQGNALPLFKKGLDKSSLNREDIFLTHSLYPRDLSSFDTAREDTESFYRTMECDYADSTLVTQSLVLKFGETQTYNYLHELLKSERTRYLSLSNASPNWIKAFKEEFGNKFFAHEGHLSFEVRALQDKAVFETCEKLGVENIIWRPLRRGKTLLHNWPLLLELSEKYKRTQTQIILNWMCEQGYRPMVFSTSKHHIDENLESVGFEMSDEDYKQMTGFRPPNYRTPDVDWEGSDGGDEIVVLADKLEITK